MTKTILNQTPTSVAASPLARLTEPHGYRFSGDTAHLLAGFVVLDPAAHQRAWALQLWACPVAPTSGRDLAGHIVAEVALPPMSEIADDTEQVEVGGFACPPAGTDDHSMALVLVAGRSGRYDEVHHVATYPRREQFIQPRLRGSVGYAIDGGRVRLTAEHIENPRSPANYSGTLALEFWALPAAYTGGAFQGLHLAGVELGSLFGQTELGVTAFDLAFSPPAAGSWHVVVMLREWTAAGYVTRDFTNFSVPVSFDPVPALPAPKAIAPVAVVPAQPVAPAPVVAAPAVPVAKVEAAKPVAPVAKVESKPAAATPAQPALPVAKVAPAKPSTVSINSAAEADLAAVEGLTPKLAQSIIKKRPFASVDDLRRVRGITVKLLEGLRSRLRL
jgi:hypothetical protein